MPASLTETRRDASAPRTPARRGRVFVIDDDEVMLLSCRRILEKDGYDVETFSNGSDGLRRIGELEPQLLDRINGHFGYPAVARLRLVQAPFPRARARPASSPPPVPSPQEQAEIGQLVAPVGDPELRAALARLGHVLRSGHLRSEADRG